MQGRAVTSRQKCNSGGKPEQKEGGSWQTGRQGPATFAAPRSPNFASLLVSERPGTAVPVRNIIFLQKAKEAFILLPDSIISLSQGTLTALQPNKNLDDSILKFLFQALPLFSSPSCQNQYIPSCCHLWVMDSLPRGCDPPHCCMAKASLAQSPLHPCGLSGVLR